LSSSWEGLTEHRDVFSLRFLDVCEPGIEVAKRENLSTLRIHQLWVVIAQGLDAPQVLKPLLLFNIVRTGERIGADMLEPTLCRQVRLGVLRPGRACASAKVEAKELK
jgi:hypothetical protein